jgi:hypothetical protein
MLPEDWGQQALTPAEVREWHGILAENVLQGRARVLLTDILRTNSPEVAERRTRDAHLDAVFDYVWRRP